MTKYFLRKKIIEVVYIKDSCEWGKAIFFILFQSVKSSVSLCTMGQFTLVERGTTCA